MVSANQDRLSGFFQIFRNGRMAGTKGSSRALTMNEQAHPFAVHEMFLDLAGVV